MPRKGFDHDEARRLREHGYTYREIADRLGVAVHSVQRACKPSRHEADVRQKTEARKRKREGLATLTPYEKRMLNRILNRGQKPVDEEFV